MTNLQKHLRIAGLLAISASLALTQTACLKTRAQLRQDHNAEEQTDGGNPTENQGEAAPKAGNYQLVEIKSEITKLNGAVEDLQHQNASEQVTQIRDNLSRIDNRVTELEKNQILLMTELKEFKDQASSAKAKEQEHASIRAKPQNALTAAFKLLEQKQYDEAAEKFKGVISAGLGNREAADAHFGLGQSLFGQKDYKKAIVSLSKVQELFSKSPRVPSSLLLIGRSFDKLNMHKEAAGFYSELKERFPKSAEAKKILNK